MESQATFNCNGKVNLNDWQLNKSSLLCRELENVLFIESEHRTLNTLVKLFDNVLPVTTAIFNIEHLTKCMEMKLKLLARYENYKHTFDLATSDEIDGFDIRTMVCDFIIYIRTYMHSIKWDFCPLKYVRPNMEEELANLFFAVKKFLGRLKYIPPSTFHYSASSLGNRCMQPQFHIYHLHLELRWFFVTLLTERCIFQKCTVDNEISDIENTYLVVIADLIYISLRVFERIPLMELRQKSPYACTCIRELWLMLQIYIDELAVKLKSKMFWEYVNLCTDIILKRNISHADTSWYKDTDSCLYSLPDCKNPELFCTWLIYHLSLLYGYDTNGVYVEHNSLRIRPNCEKLETILKAYICKGGKDGERDEIDEELKIMIPLIEVLVLEWRQIKVSIISLLWDCFHKRLEQPFLVQTAGPWTLSLDKKSAADILKQIQNRICSTLEQSKESSFGMFLHLLGNFLKANYSCNDTKYWNQIKSRVYSKFSKSKVQEFSLNGLYNFLSLFLTLAITADTSSVCSVMIDLLPSVHETNNADNKRTTLVWKGQLAVLLLFSELQLCFNNVAMTFVDVVNTLSCHKDDTSRSMMIAFVDVLDIIISTSDATGCNKYLFIGGWIDRYLLECSKNQISSLLKILVNIFEKYSLKYCNRSGEEEKMMDALWCHVACRVRQLVFDPNLLGNYYHDLSRLAVAFTLEALKNPATAKRHKHSAASLFQHFTASAVVKDIRVTRRYLLLILKETYGIESLKKEIKNFDVILIQVWIKCSILECNGNTTETMQLQGHIAQLDDIKGIFITEQELNSFMRSNEPILVFMMSSMKKRNLLETEQLRNLYDTRWRLYFSNIEKWILVYVSDESKESELAFWIYRCIGTLILCTSLLLYVKSQPNNMLKLLISKLVLPEQSIHSYLKSWGRRIFSMILLGIQNLNVKSDISLQALIRDLLDQYIPLLITETDCSSNSFKISDTLLKLFQDAKMDFLHLLLEILMASFFCVSSDKTMHKYSSLIIALLKNLLRAGKLYPNYMVEFIITICGQHIIGCYMKIHERHPHKQSTIDFINDIMSNAYYKESDSIRQMLINIINDVVQKYLIVNPQCTFKLIRSIALQNVDIIMRILPQMEIIVLDAERNRRSNAASLRYSWNQLQNYMQTLVRDKVVKS